MMPKSIDNSQIVREVDPRSNRHLWSLLFIMLMLVGGVALYAWPHLAFRQTGMATEQLYRERERLLEENRKLRLEKASLENLRRVETIAVRDLGLETPKPERLVVIERPQALPDGARLARDRPGDDARN
jgi:cell division protein FtsL